jgi:hypothetical protein
VLFSDFPHCKKIFFPIFRNFQNDIQRLSHLFKPVEVTDDEKNVQTELIHMQHDKDCINIRLPVLRNGYETWQTYSAARIGAL